MLREANLTSRALMAALSVCLAVASAGMAMAQATLPPPPYAIQGAAVSARGGIPVYDRYGGGVVHAPPARAKALSPAQVAYTGPRLVWGGKSAEAPQIARPAGPTPWRTVQARTPYAAPTTRARLQYPSMAMAETAQATPTPEAYTPPVYTPSPGKDLGQPTAPTSIYDPAPPASRPVMPAPPTRTAAAAQGEGPRLYSLHRDYGMAPDPIPLAPQFFGPTADLTAPETPEVGHRTKTAAGTLVNAPTDAGGDR